MDIIVNKVAESGIMTLDLAPYIPEADSFADFDLKPFLFRELILREKDYRTALQTFDWSSYEGKNVAIFCSVDAIIPMWAYMLASAYLQPVAQSIYFGTQQEMKKWLVSKNIGQIDIAEYNDKRVVLKGCGDTPIPEMAYIAATERLRPIVKSLMYGEPCSTVPIYKKPK